MVGKKTYLDIFTYVIMSSALRQLFLMRFSFIVVLSLDLVPYRFVCYHIAHRHTSTAGLSRYRVRIVWNLCDWLTANVCVCVCSYRQLQLLLWSLSEFYIGTDITFLCVLSSAQWGSSTMPTQQCEWRRRKKLCEKYNGDIYGEWWWFGWMDEGRGPLQHTTRFSVLLYCIKRTASYTPNSKRQTNNDKTLLFTIFLLLLLYSPSLIPLLNIQFEFNPMWQEDKGTAAPTVETQMPN